MMAPENADNTEILEIGARNILFCAFRSPVDLS